MKKPKKSAKKSQKSVKKSQESMEVHFLKCRDDFFVQEIYFSAFGHFLLSELEKFQKRPLKKSKKQFDTFADEAFVRRTILCWGGPLRCCSSPLL